MLNVKIFFGDLYLLNTSYTVFLTKTKNVSCNFLKNCKFVFCTWNS